MRGFIKACPIAAFAIFLCANSLARADDLTEALKLKMKYLSQSQAVISKNLANSNTPNYKSMEVQEPRYSSNGKSLAMVTTSPTHIGSASHNGKFKITKQKDTYETAPNGNNVSIEEQMVKMSSNSSEHQAATNLMHKVNGLYGLALGEK